MKRSIVENASIMDLIIYMTIGIAATQRHRSLKTTQDIMMCVSITKGKTMTAKEIVKEIEECVAKQKELEIKTKLIKVLCENPYSSTYEDLLRLEGFTRAFQDIFHELGDDL